MKSINIKGKEYYPVNERILHFLSEDIYKGWTITTEIVNLSDDRVVMKCLIHDEMDRLRATGHAYEDSESTFINKTSFIENCETSCVGRALGMLGIGIDDAFASANEVQNAVKQQEDTRQWLSEKQFQQALKRIAAGETGIYESCDKEFKMKKDYRQQLKDAANDLPFSGN